MDRKSLHGYIDRSARTLGLAAGFSALVLITLGIHSLAQVQLMADLDSSVAGLPNKPDGNTMLSIIEPVYAITLTASPDRIPVSGQTSLLAATVTNLFHSPVPDGTEVQFETSLGTLGSRSVTRATAGGVATETLTSGSIAGTAHLTATAGSDHAYSVVDFFWHEIRLPFAAKDYPGE